MTDATRGSARSRLKITPARDLRKYTQEIWLAGLGAFSRAEEEGGRLFDNLVKIGEELEHKTKEIADNTAGELRDKVLGKATDTREKVERVLDDSLHTTLSKLGIPTQKEFEALADRMDQLTRVIEQLARQLEKNR